jgi:hypothetical protein
MLDKFANELKKGSKGSQRLFSKVLNVTLPQVKHALSLVLGNILDVSICCIKKHVPR